MLGESDLVGAAARRGPGVRLTSMMAPTIALSRAGAPRLVLGSAGSARLRGAIMQIVVNVLEHGLGVGRGDRRAPAPFRRARSLHCEGGHEPGRARAARRARLRARPLAAPQPLLRRRGRGRAAPRRRRAAAGDPPPGGAGVVVVGERGCGCGRPCRATPARLVALAVRGRGRGGGLAARRRRAGAASGRSAATSAPFSATPTRRSSWPRRGRRARRPALAHARPAPLEQPRRRPRPDGRRLAAPPRDRHGADGGGRELGAGGRDQRSSSCTSSPHNRPAIALYAKLGYEREGLRLRHYRARTGAASDVLLMAKRLP